MNRMRTEGNSKPGAKKRKRRTRKSTKAKEAILNYIIVCCGLSEIEKEMKINSGAIKNIFLNNF